MEEKSNGYWIESWGKYLTIDNVDEFIDWSNEYAPGVYPPDYKPRIPIEDSKSVSAL